MSDTVIVVGVGVGTKNPATINAPGGVTYEFEKGGAVAMPAHVAQWLLQTYNTGKYKIFEIADPPLESDPEMPAFSNHWDVVVHMLGDGVMAKLVEGGIDDMDDLMAAIDAGSLTKINGVGAKTAEQIAATVRDIVANKE